MSLKWKLVRPIEGVRYNNRVTAELANQPRLLPHSQFSNIDAIYRWFRPVGRKADRHVLNTASLRPFANTAVPLEYTGPDPTGASAKLFKRFDAPLGVFLDYIENPPEHVRMYLAQCSLKSLPPPMRKSLPLPDFLRTHGARKKGSALDIYDTSLWIGLPPTYTPLHRDPNPNCFFQMAGRKTVRLLPPDKGLELFQRVKRRIGEDGGDLSGRMRGEEMMMGRERDELEREVWDTVYDPESGGLEARLERGYGLFIPEGWWHSVKGHGTTITASVNWWFRMREIKPGPMPAGLLQKKISSRDIGRSKLRFARVPSQTPPSRGNGRNRSERSNTNGPEDELVSGRN